MNSPVSYCDYNATTPVRPLAAAAVAKALAQGGNASSVHGVGRAARATQEAARERLAAAVGAQSRDVIFTSGATEALHRALDAARGAHDDLIVSSIEHDAVAEGCAPTDRIACTPEGVIDLDDLDRALSRARRPLVAVMLANNETGVLQPIAAVARRVREAGGLLLVDAAQALGRVDVDARALDAAYLVVSSHKLGGPPGAGALVLAPGAPDAPARRGGGQEQGRRPGTENGPAIAGFAAALETDFLAERSRVAGLRDAFEAGLLRDHPDAVIFGASADRLPNTSQFALPGLPAETALIALDLAGVAMSAGSACSSGKVRPSRVLAAMGVGAALARCAMRASFGWASTHDDVARALAALGAARSRRLAGAA
ncbi:MAG: cysteine desulfurase family protein [Hyphomonadaceae bacterium]|nr:cysteine desulfurase family protein [Hyphomonadaceae bacterium]